MKCLKFVLLATICLMTTACASMQGRDPATTDASNEWRLQSLEESFLNFREDQRLQVDEAHEKAAALEKRLTAVEVELAALKAATLNDDGPDDMADVTPPAMGEELKVEPGDEGWTDGGKSEKNGMAQSGEEKPWAKVPGPPPALEAEKMKPSRAASTKPKATPAPAKSGFQAMYDKALADYQADKFDQARTEFEAFLAKYPKSDLVPNALYWKGETFYSQKDFAQAILSFKEVTGRYPKHAKAAAALLKIGMSYDHVGDKDNAIFYLRALVEDFPESDPAKLARVELKRLGG